MTTCPTVLIKSPAPGHEAGVVINEADFDPAVHDLFDAKPAPVKPAKKPRKQ